MEKRQIVGEILQCADYFDDSEMFQYADGLTNIAIKLAQIEDFSPTGELGGEWDQGISDEDTSNSYNMELDKAMPFMQEPESDNNSEDDDLAEELTSLGLIKL